VPQCAPGVPPRKIFGRHVGPSAIVLGSLLHSCYLAGAPLDHLGVKAASSRYVVPGCGAAYLVTWAYDVSGCTTWCRRLLESLFPLCSFSGHVIKLLIASGQGVGYHYPNAIK
jgi:hypothetical protein